MAHRAGDRVERQLSSHRSSSLTLDRLALMVEAALSGMGIAFVLEQSIASHLASGALLPLLADWCPADERYMLYYPGRRHVPAPLRAFVDHLRQMAP